MAIVIGNIQDYAYGVTLLSVRKFNKIAIKDHHWN